jgi:signal transduction histidine kinase
MDDMLRGLLDYGDIAEQLNTLQRINLDEFIRGLLAELHRVIRERDAAIEVARPLPDVRGAPSLVTHAVTPIVVNALLYTRAGERPSVRIYAEEKPQTIVLSVADHGIGIDPCNHERIFRIFERLHCYSDYPGAGLGLAIARRAAEKLGGRIGVDSKLGEGACFHLELPKG